jgi:hypothetical protein
MCWNENLILYLTTVESLDTLAQTANNTVMFKGCFERQLNGTRAWFIFPFISRNHTDMHPFVVNSFVKLDLGLVMDCYNAGVRAAGGFQILLRAFFFFDHENVKSQLLCGI